MSKVKDLEIGKLLWISCRSTVKSMREMSREGRGGKIAGWDNERRSRRNLKCERN